MREQDMTANLGKASLETVNMPEYHTNIPQAGLPPMGLNSQQSVKNIAEETEISKMLLTE
jgi:hypothetical protein